MADALLTVINELRMATECTCTFGHEGGYQLATIMGDICSKKGKPGDLALMRDLAPVMASQAICGEGRAIGRAVQQALDLFGDEIEAHITKKQCQTGGCPAFQTYHILVSKCTGCGKCLKACDDKAILGKAKFVHVINQRSCTQCGACLEACPEGAVVRAGAKKPKTPPKPIPVRRK
jgi:NADH-quinone oxidoreductase subunit F